MNLVCYVSYSDLKLRNLKNQLDFENSNKGAVVKGAVVKGAENECLGISASDL